jgi:hypothetical protein
MSSQKDIDKERIVLEAGKMNDLENRKACLERQKEFATKMLNKYLGNDPRLEEALQGVANTKVGDTYGGSRGKTPSRKKPMNKKETTTKNVKPKTTKKTTKKTT